MIIHRDYRSPSDSVVKIFNDKIEFYNPGRLPDTISIKDLLSNNYKSTLRNKKIAEFFKDLGLIEKYGSGIGRIVNYFKSEGLPVPEFKNISDGFQVTVFARKQSNVTENVIENVTENVTENPSVREEKILELVEINQKSTYSKLSKQLSVTRMTIIRDIQTLKAKGLIERIGPDKGGYWKINR